MSPRHQHHLWNSSLSPSSASSVTASFCSAEVLIHSLHTEWNVLFLLKTDTFFHRNKFWKFKTNVSHKTLPIFSSPTQERCSLWLQGAEKRWKGPLTPRRDLQICTVLSVNSSMAACSQYKMGLNQNSGSKNGLWPDESVCRIWKRIQIRVYKFNSWYNAANQRLEPELPESHSPDLPAEPGSSCTARMLQAVIDPLCQKEAKKFP